MSLAASARFIARGYVSGLLDSLKVPSAALFFLTSDTLRKRAVACFLLNCVIFMGRYRLVLFLLLNLSCSVIIVQHVLSPLFRFVLRVDLPLSDAASAEKLDSLGNTVESIFALLYQVCCASLGSGVKADWLRFCGSILFTASLSCSTQSGMLVWPCICVSRRTGIKTLRTTRT